MIVVAPNGPCCYGNGYQVLVACDVSIKFLPEIQYVIVQGVGQICTHQKPKNLAAFVGLFCHTLPVTFVLHFVVHSPLVCLFPPFCCALCTNAERTPTSVR